MTTEGLTPGSSLTDARHIEGRGVPGNAVLDLSMSVRAHILDPDE